MTCGEYVLQVGKARGVLRGHDFWGRAGQFRFGRFRQGRVPMVPGRRSDTKVVGPRNAKPALSRNGLVDQPEDGAAFVKERNERTKSGAAGQESAGAIDGIENPEPVAAGAAYAVFLA